MTSLRQPEPSCAPPSWCLGVLAGEEQATTANVMSLMHLWFHFGRDRDGIGIDQPPSFVTAGPPPQELELIG